MPEEYIGRGAADISLGEETSGYSKVVVVDKDGKEYSAGTNTGNTLTVNCPWATQNIANSLLQKYNGKRYQAFTATDAYISPEVELGWKVNVAGVLSGVLKQRTEYGELMASTVSAPGEEELEHEFEYVTRVDREIKRQGKVFGRAIANAVQASKDAILEAHNELVAALTMADGAPEDLAAGISNYVRYDLKNNTGFAGTSLFAKIGETAVAKIDAYVIDDGKGNAKSFLDLMADTIALKADTIELKAVIGDVNTGLESKASVKYVDDTFYTKKAANKLSSEVADAKSSLETLAETSLSKDDAGKIYYTQEAAAKLKASIDSTVGKLEAGLDAKVDTSTLGGYLTKTAASTLYATIDNVNAGLSAKVSTKDLTETLKAYTTNSALSATLSGYLTKAAAEVYATDGEVTSLIGTYVVGQKDGSPMTLAAILADQIKLEGRVDLSGVLTVGETLNVDRGIFTKGNVLCSNVSLHDGGQLLCHHVTLQDGGYIRIGPKVFTPQEITSTTGAVMALGYT